MKSTNKYLKFTSVAFQMIFIIGGGALLGIYLDGEEGKLYTILFSLLGVFVGMYLVIKEAINMMKK
ncbi:MAG: AtpZ/AtpI family protein [Flavobacteriales bacterium]|jgi:F0F1-type ATP synthase assembly protein I|nr:AtpZ/AtpI family protein [Flavobacteriales bacterium]